MSEGIIHFIPEIGSKLPIHSLVDCSNLNPSRGNQSTLQDEKSALLKVAFQGLQEHGISPFSTLGVFLRYRDRIQKLSQLFPERNSVNDYNYIWRRIAEGIQAEANIILEAQQINYESWASSQNMKILAKTALGTTERRIGISDSPEIMNTFYQKHGNPITIRAKLKTLIKKFGKNDIYYLGQWREAKWEVRLYALRALEHYNLPAINKDSVAE